MAPSDASLHLNLQVAPADEHAAVLRAAATGDNRAWQTLVALYSRRVYAMALSRLGSPELAQEITQSVFVTIAQHLSSGRYTEQGRFEPWLFRITANRIRDEARRQRRHALPTDPAQLPQQQAPSDHTTPETLDSMRAAMQQLPEHERSVLQLRYHAQLPFAHIATILGKPLGTVLAQHHRALAKLKQTMTQTP
jgi:RNA polymerase sigma-70 factor, ECF subfamily